MKILHVKQTKSKGADEVFVIFVLLSSLFTFLMRIILSTMTYGTCILIPIRE